VLHNRVRRLRVALYQIVIFSQRIDKLVDKRSGVILWDGNSRGLFFTTIHKLRYRPLLGRRCHGRYGSTFWRTTGESAQILRSKCHVKSFKTIRYSSTYPDDAAAVAGLAAFFGRPMARLLFFRSGNTNTRALLQTFARVRIFHQQATVQENCAASPVGEFELAA
jgi:hypothetical protein